jgi:predicted DNA-binding protein (MmcQ/YjbR family)
LGLEALVDDIGGTVFARCRIMNEHQAIKPGWHMNKKHWNTLVLDGSVPPKLIRELVQHSYDLVVASLPAKARAKLLPSLP